MLNVPPFAERCRSKSRTVWDASFDHPFVRALIDGSLPRDTFRFYQMQDARYLEAYADVCSLISTRYVSPSDKAWFIDGAKLALVVEQELHTAYGLELGYTPEDVAQLELTPNNRAYQNHMIACATRGSLLEALGALAPCPWLYTDIGFHITSVLGEIPEDHPYRNWLMTYTDPAFVKYTEDLLNLFEREVLQHGAGYHARSEQAFHTSVTYEWMFWDQAWNRQKWPI